MSFTYDLTTSIGKVRNLIGDTTQTGAIFTDEEITSILSIQGSDVLNAAALALTRIAASKALLSKKKSAGNYSEDLTQIAKDCLAVAKEFRDMALSTPADAVAEQILTDFNYNDILKNKALRDESD